VEDDGQRRTTSMGASDFQKKERTGAAHPPREGGAFEAVQSKIILQRGEKKEAKDLWT